jgi:uncharacterized membrane protein YdbT with pleckstrin-like domain
MSKLIGITSPSQFINIGWCIFTVLGWFIHPLFAGVFGFLLVWGILDVMTWRYEFYNNFIIEKRGVLNVTEEMVYYFRIKSVKVYRPLWMRFFGLCVIHMTTSEQFKPQIKLYAIEDGSEFVQFIEKKTRLKRNQNGVRDMDFFNI